VVVVVGASVVVVGALLVQVLPPRLQWQFWLPVSVKVLPASGTNRQS
jgi:hypothetical protein